MESTSKNYFIEDTGHLWEKVINEALFSPVLSKLMKLNLLKKWYLKNISTYL